jgi:SAM-dependent methyltransferase
VNTDWVEDFYTKQDKWAGVYGGAVEALHREKAALVEIPGETAPLRVLELGCGGGQVACAIADRGHSVVAIDSNPRAIEQSRRLASERSDKRMTVIRGDFYTIDLDGRFDVVCYFDGFGIGEDEDQWRLLRRIAEWLAPGGRAVIEVYTPWYCSKAAGRVMEWENVSRRYDYDVGSHRMLDTWWPTDNPSVAVTQSLRCYAPEEFRRLLESTGLEWISTVPGGAYDHDAGIYREQAPLGEAMQYVATLELSGRNPR